MKAFITVLTIGLTACVFTGYATEYHVSKTGLDDNPGTESKPFKTIMAAAKAAQPGDTITVHEGTYRESINPPRGGTSDAKRIVYRAAPGERVTIKGSEIIKGWKPVGKGVWKVTLPNTFFGKFNPYDDLVTGNWFRPRDRNHHTGAVYLNGEWRIEAPILEDVLDPDGSAKMSDKQLRQQAMMNVAWVRPVHRDKNSERIPAVSFTNQQGVQTAPCSEGGKCISGAKHGDWVEYKDVDFGEDTLKVELRAASASRGGMVDIFLNKPNGRFMGSCFVPNTGGEQVWDTFTATFTRSVSGRQTLCLVFRIAKPMKKYPAGSPLWYGRVDDKNTTIWAQFGKANPNRETAEINVRRTVFYPDKPGRNYITVRGFTLRDAAPNWAPPTAEQMGLIGTHWSRGWIIENNIISHSINTGLTLGKYGDEFDNLAWTADAYNGSIERALSNGWKKGGVGHHIVRNNSISYCEQAGIVGSMGASFSRITGNHIFKIHVQGRFTGAEMAGIKFHAPVDVLVKGNRIHETTLALWLDWMAQGTRVTGNLFYNNGQDVFLEVNHGPCLVDNNLFLSNMFCNRSEGGAFVHNLFAGQFSTKLDHNRRTPYFKPHTNEKAGLSKIDTGDDRFYNNMFVGDGRGEPSVKSTDQPTVTGVVGRGLFIYDDWPTPLQTGGNIYYHGAHPYSKERDFTSTQTDPAIKIEELDDGVYLHITLDPVAKDRKTKLITSELLGLAKVPQARFENADGTPITIDTDYFGNKRNPETPTAGPFANPGAGALTLKVW